MEQKYFMHAILYSKDRPFQVQQLLRSFDRFLFTHSEKVKLFTPKGDEIKGLKLEGEFYFKVSVYYTYSQEKFGQLYA
jgi:hypothetical protein